MCSTLLLLKHFLSCLEYEWIGSRTLLYYINVKYSVLAVSKTFLSLDLTEKIIYRNKWFSDL